MQRQMLSNLQTKSYFSQSHCSSPDIKACPQLTSFCSATTAPKTAYHSTTTAHFISFNFVFPDDSNKAHLVE